MSQWIRTFFFVAFCLVLIIGGLFFYYKRQVGYMPEWYLTTPAEQSIETNPDASAGHATMIRPKEGTAMPDRGKATYGDLIAKDTDDRLVFRFKSNADPSRTLELQLGREGRLAIGQEEVMPLLLQSMAAEGGNKMAEAIKAAKATIRPGAITLEMVVSVDEIPMDELDAIGQKTVVWLKEFLQKSHLQQVYLKADLYPLVQQGEMILQPHSSVSVGKVKFSLGELHRRLGIPMHVSMDRFIFSDFELQSGRVVLIK